MEKIIAEHLDSNLKSIERCSEKTIDFMLAGEFTKVIENLKRIIVTAEDSQILLNLNK